MDMANSDIKAASLLRQIYLKKFKNKFKKNLPIQLIKYSLMLSKKQTLNSFNQILMLTFQEVKFINSINIYKIIFIFFK